MTYEFLHYKIVECGKSAIDIAKEMGVNPSTVNNLAIKYNLKFKYKEKLTKDFLLEEYVNKQRSIIEIANSLSCSHTYVSKQLSKFGIEIRKCGYAGALKTNKTIGQLTGVQWCQIYRSWMARSERITEFSLTQKEAWDIYEKQNGRCAFSGIEIRLAKNTKELYSGNRTASLDRIDSRLGYNKNNVCWVHKTINNMKYDFSSHYFIYICKRVSNYTSGMQHNNFYCEYLPHRGINSTGVGYVTGSVYSAINPEKKKEFYVSREYLNNLFISQGFSCKLSGLPIYLPVNRKEFVGCMKSASLDRIDSSKGYIEGNVQWLHIDINQSKWDFDQSEYIEWCHRITENENRI